MNYFGVYKIKNGVMMAYSLEEQETFIQFDALTKTWTIESSYSPHVNRMLKQPDAYKILNTEVEDDRVIWMQANVLIGEDFSINIFPRKKRKLTEEQRNELSEWMKKTRVSQ